jgi:YfiH family protein
MILTSQLLSVIPGVRHGFGTRGENIPDAMVLEWTRSAPHWKQVHGVACAEVIAPAQECGEVDALYTLQPKVPIAVVTADCVPILLARISGGAVAAVHAGWRGTRAGIVRELWKKLSFLGERPSDWVAAVGPAIGPCCYEVSEELAEDFLKTFGAPAVPRHRILDLPGINRTELLSLGLREVEVLRNCTRCSLASDGVPEPLFHSYRREGGGTRQYSMISA